MSRLKVMPRWLGRFAVAGLLALLIGTLPAGAASADNAVPTNYKSTVFDVDPAVSGATFRVVGGDAFMEVVVAEGHEVLIPGYFREPYIRIDADGSVWLNLDSPAYYINQDRYGNVQAPPEADGKGEPRWERAGSDGRFAWQDHRVHWMSRDLPPTVGGDLYQVVFPWNFPVVVDGQDASVRGELVWVPSRNLYWPLLAGALGLLLLVFWDRMSTRSVAAALGLVAGLALVVQLIQYSGTPSSVGGMPMSSVLPLLAGVAAIVGLVLGESRPRLGLVFLGGGGVALVSWALINLGTLWLPVLPAAAASNVQRVGVALAIWAGLSVTATAAIKLVSDR